MLHTLIGQDILCLSSIDWDFNWQGHQKIMATLVEQVNRVLFVENTGVCPPTLRNLPRLRRWISNWWQETKGSARRGEFSLPTDLPVGSGLRCEASAPRVYQVPCLQVGP